MDDQYRVPDYGSPANGPIDPNAPLLPPPQPPAYAPPPPPPPTRPGNRYEATGVPPQHAPTGPMSGYPSSGPLQPGQPGYYQPSGPLPQQQQWPSGPMGARPTVPLQPGQGYYAPSGPLPQGYYQPSGPLPQQGYYPQSGPLPLQQPGYYQPSGPLSPQPGYYQVVAQPVPPVVVVQQHNDSSNAVLIECLCGFFGFYGIGWMMSGYTTAGILLLLGGFVWEAIFWTIVIFTASLGLICVGPIDLALWITSGVILSNTLKKRTTIIVR